MKDFYRGENGSRSQIFRKQIFRICCINLTKLGTVNIMFLYKHQDKGVHKLCFGAFCLSIMLERRKEGDADE